MGRLWRGMGGDRPPRRQHGRLGFHRPRDTKHGFSLSLRRLQGEQPQARPTGFHETRNTRHESRPLCFSSHDFPRFPGITHDFPAPPPPWERVRAPFGRCFPARCGAAWGGYGAAWAAVVPRAGNTADWVFTSNESRNMFSPCPPATPRRATPSPANGVFTNHETRITNHGLYAFAAAFLRIVVRHGAAMARHGRPSSPAPATRPIGFSPETNHATCFPPALRRLQGEQPQARPTGFSRITNHETRITAFMLFFPRFPTISRHFPRFPGPPPTPLGKGPRAVRSLLSCALWRGIGRQWRGMGGRRPPRRQHGRLGFHQQRITQHVFLLSSGDSKESNPKPGQRVFHESRNTNHESRLFTLP